MITRKALQLFRNSNAFLQMIDRQYDDQYAKTGAKIGSALKIRLPNDYTVRVGTTAVVQNTAETSVTLNVTQQVGVDVQFSSAELALSLDDFATRCLAPMINNLAGFVAGDIMTGAENIPNLVHNVDGSNNTITPTPTTWLTAGAVLDKFSCPRDQRNVLLDPVTMARTVGSLTGLFNAQDKIGNQYKKGLVAMDTLGFDWAMDQTVRLHTEGTFVSGTVSATTGQTGTAITVTSTTGILNVGDIITIAGVVAVNRVNKNTTGQLMQFVVTTQAPGGSTTLNIYPAILPQVASANVAYQTVVSSPAAGAAITQVVNANEVYRKNFAFHPTAVTMATADLQLPSAAVLGAHREAYSGISIRTIQDYIPQTDVFLTRTDLLYGYVWPRPEWAVIVGDIV